MRRLVRRNHESKQEPKPTNMSTTKSNRVIEPYLFFNGRCEEAVKFYQKALGAELQMMMRYKESPEPLPPGMTPPNWGDKIMHASVRIGATIVMASDGCGEKTAFEGFSLSLTVSDEAEADRVFAALAEGGQVRMPLGKTFWSPRFGMVQDRFGVGWMVSVMHKQP
jgi:PhnB protein